MLGIAADQDAFERHPFEQPPHRPQLVTRHHRFLVEHEPLLDGERSHQGQAGQVRVALHRAQRLAVEGDVTTTMASPTHRLEAREPVGQHALEVGGSNQAQKLGERGHAGDGPREAEGSRQRGSLLAAPLLDGQK